MKHKDSVVQTQSQQKSSAERSDSVGRALDLGSKGY